MALRPDFPALPTPPYHSLNPETRWFPADQRLRRNAYEKPLPPLVEKIRGAVAGDIRYRVAAIPAEDGGGRRQDESDLAPNGAGDFIELVEQWTGSYVFENEGRSFRTRCECEPKWRSAPLLYERTGCYLIAVKVVDIVGNDTMSLMLITVG